MCNYNKNYIFRCFLIFFSRLWLWNKQFSVFWWMWGGVGSLKVFPCFLHAILLILDWVQQCYYLDFPWNVCHNMENLCGSPGIVISRTNISYVGDVANNKLIKRGPVLYLVESLNSERRPQLPVQIQQGHMGTVWNRPSSPRIAGVKTKSHIRVKFRCCMIV